MARQAALLGAILVVVLLAVWLGGSQEPRNGAAIETSAQPTAENARESVALEFTPADVSDVTIGREPTVTVESRAVGETSAEGHAELDPRDGGELRFFVRVLARDDKAPIVGASVELLSRERSVYQEEPTSEAALAKGATDSVGLFEVRPPSWKGSELRVRAAGFGETFVEVGKGRDTPEKARVLLLSRAASLRARLLDAGGAPLADGAVQMWTESFRLATADGGLGYSPSLSDRYWTQEADLSGSCVLEDLPPDVPFHVVILRAGFVVKKDLPSLQLQAGEVREVEWRLGSGCRLEGSVIDQEGEFVPSLTLWLQRADSDDAKIFHRYSGDLILDTTTDSRGRFAFGDVSPGRCWLGPAPTREHVRAHPDPRAIAPAATVVEVAQGSSRQEVLLRVHRGIYIQGRVLDSKGRPASQTHVMGFTAAGALLSSGAGMDGRFTLGPLEPGRYRLQASSPKGARSDWTEAYGGDGEAVLVLKPGGSMSGKIRDAATGESCPGRVTAVASDARDDRSWGQESGDDGSFRFDGIPPGNYCLAVRASGGRVGITRGVSVALEREATDLVVTVAPGAALRLEYAGSSGYLMVLIRSEGVLFCVSGVAAGQSSTLAVPAGQLVVEGRWVHSDTDKTPSIETRPIHLAVGEEKELVFGEP
jgi:hypothetical protein